MPTQPIAPTRAPGAHLLDSPMREDFPARGGSVGGQAAPRPDSDPGPQRAERLDRVAPNELGAECARWLDHGETRAAG